MRQLIDYSVVIPIFNEAETIPELWQRLFRVFLQLGGPWEIIFINDGSTDESPQLLNHLSVTHPEIKVIHLSRNFGHQCALAAGIDHANGRAVILMDGDLQDAPEAILSFIECWQQGYEVVYAIRAKRKEHWLKKFAFHSFYRLQNQLSGLPLPLDAGIFSLLDRKVILALRQMPERSKYLSGLRAYAGFRQTGVVVERDRRYWGQPKVSVFKLFKLAFDGVFSFSTIPLKIATYFGLVCSIVSFIIGTIGLYYKFVLGREFLSWAYGLTTTFFIGGVQLLSLGIIGEYIGRIYEEVKQRPYYIIDKKINFDDF